MRGVVFIITLCIASCCMAQVGSDQMLRPGEDPYEKIRQNLFLRLTVNKKNCYPGEPVLATFKLYSRLKSKSDIIKNPGFYGFTVYDMINLADNKVTNENVNGKLFDVHTVRMVQLFPLQPGMFRIDPMEVKNEVEFSRSIVNKKGEQEVTEGVLNVPDNNTDLKNAETFETTIHTDPVIINVSPLPAGEKPTGFNGAFGKFNIAMALSKRLLSKNETGSFDIRISGEGNFTQLNPPIFEWPSGIEGFEPVIKDSLDRSKFPLAGSRTFHFSFISGKPGHYNFQPLSISYFDPASKNYKTTSSAAAAIEISDEEKPVTAKVEKRISIKEKNERASLIAGAIIICLTIIVLLYWIKFKKPDVKVNEAVVVQPSMYDLLKPAENSINSNNKDFFKSLHQCIWSYLMIRLDIAGSDQNKKVLQEKLQSKHVSQGNMNSLIQVLEQCETGMFTDVEVDTKNESIYQEAKDILEKIDFEI